MGSSSSWMKIGLVLVAVAAAALMLRGLELIIRLLLIGGLLAYLLDPLARTIESRGLNRRQATAVICTGLAILVGAVGYALSPIVAAQLSGLQQGFDVSDVDLLLQKLDWLVNSILSRLGLSTVDVPSAVHKRLEMQSRNVLDLGPNVFSLIANAVVVPIITFFLLRDGPDMKKAFISWVPNRYFEFALTVVHKSSRKLSGYLRGQAVEALVVGTLAVIALGLIGVDYYVIIGAVAGITNIVPYLGPLAGGLLAVSVSALTTGSFDTAPWIIISLLIIQLIDNMVVQPMVLSRSVQMHPLAVILVLILGGQLFGLWGLLLGVPVAAIVKVVVSEVARNLRRFRLA